jgi:hypothetical protein
MTRGRVRRAAARLASALVSALVVLLGAPRLALAHSLSGQVASPLPFVAYIGGAAVAVGLSFFFVAISDPGPPTDAAPDAARRVPRWLRVGTRGVGLVAWLWMVVQAIVGGSSDADVAYLFLWIYGWVALPILCGLVGPVWSWLDPFSTLHDIGAWALRKAGVRGLAPQPYPERLGIWPAIGGFVFFVWLELVARITGGQVLGLVMIGYTLVTLVGMAQYGKQAWRRQGETFSVWLGLIGRLAPYGLVGEPEAGRLHRRPFASALMSSPWTVDQVVLVAVGTAAILYDGASQTRPFFDLFGFPNVALGSLLLVGFLALLALLVLGVGRRVGLAAMGAGIAPVALGYLVAHYFTALLTDGQRMAIALSDPFQQGWNLIGASGYQPSIAVLPTGVVWGIQVAAVVLGHVVGAWAGHATARARPVTTRPRTASRAASGAAAARAGRGRATEGQARSLRPSQAPLAILMICLTSATLWSLGQNLVFQTAPPASSAPAQAPASSPAPTAAAPAAGST